MIKSISATGVQGRLNVEATFHPDINIFTGINGSGKTTLLKLIWYLVSANIERVFSEITFDAVTLSTNAFDLSLKAEMHGNTRVITIQHNIDGIPTIKGPEEQLVEEPPNLKRLNQRTSALLGPTVFFPTFRRIEGGFSLGRPEGRMRARHPDGYFVRYESGPSVDEALRTLSGRLSIGQNVFVSSLSTEDIAQLVTTRYAAISESTNKLLLDTAREILKSSGQVEAGSRTAEEVLKQVTEAAKTTAKNQEELLSPFTVLSKLVRSLFQSKGIKVGQTTTLGDAQNAILSDLLSAGEKQMLSFLVYNAFYQDASIFIDEPEISLHVDWQRRLFALLLEQSTTNQFFVATHSPFIYQKYSDKEILLASSRGE